MGSPALGVSPRIPANAGSSVTSHAVVSMAPIQAEILTHSALGIKKEASICAWAMCLESALQMLWDVVALLKQSVSYGS